MDMSRRDFLKLTGVSALALFTQQYCAGMDKMIYYANDFYGSFIDGLRTRGRSIIVPPFQIGLTSNYNFTNAFLASIATRESPGYKFQFRDRVNLREVAQMEFRGVKIHFFHTSGLYPGRDYPYEIPGTKIKGTIKTGNRVNDDISFLMVSDTQNEHNSKQQNQIKSKLVQLMLNEQKNHRFIINGGDLTEHSYISEYVYNFFPSSMPLLSHVPMYPTKGNHDYKGTGFDKVFGSSVKVPGAPVRSRWSVNYSFDCGPIHFSILDSHFRHKNARKFLERDLKRSKNKFNIVVMHHAFRVDTEDLPVHAVFAGHIHNYRRLRHKKTKVPYIVFGGGGCWMFLKDTWLPLEKEDNLEKLVSHHIPHYLTGQVTGNQLHFKMIDVYGSTRDSFTIRS